MNIFDDAMYEVLQKSRYDKLTGRSLDIRGMAEDALVRLVEWVISKFEFNLPDNNNINTNMVAVFFVVAGGIVLMVTAVLIIRNLHNRKKTVKKDLNGVFEEIAKKDLSAREWLALSQDYFNAGTHREAMRYRFIAVLVALNEKRLIRIEASKTNAQILNELVVSAPELVPSFSVITDCFHRSWFGYKTLYDSEFEKIAINTEAIFTGIRQ
jgi:hypothetical protein